MSKRIIDLLSGSISDSSQGFIGDPNTGALTRTSYRAMKDYFLTGSSLLLTGSYVTTGSFNIFSSSYSSDSSSFTKINSNLILSQSGLTPIASFNPFTSSYITDSSSFDQRIRAISGSIPSGSYVTTLNFNIFSASYTANSSSFNTSLINAFASESNYTPTSSFNAFTAGYVVDSSSFNSRINNVLASESIYTQTSSFNQLSGSYSNDSSSFNSRIINTFLSESGYLPTASIFGNNNYIVIYSGSQGFTYGNLYQSGSSILINQVNGVNDALLQVAGAVSINATSYLQVPRGTTAQRPPTSSIGASGSLASFGMFRGNTDTTNLEFYNGVAWVSLGSGSGLFFTGSVTSVGLTLPPQLFTLYNSPVVGAGTISGSLNTQSAGYVFVGPTSSTGVPSFRPLVMSDIVQLTGSFVMTSSFNQLSSSYSTDSSSFDSRINSVFSSESGFTPLVSFNSFTSSVNAYTSSTAITLANIYASESNYTPSSSYLAFSSSYYNDSSSNVIKFNNVYASESNYLPTSSINGSANYIAVYKTVNSLTTGSIFQSGSNVLVGSTTGSNNAILQVFGNIYISKSLYDSTNSTGTSGQVLSSTPTGLKWVSTAGTINTLNFIVGDGGPYTPLSGSTLFSSSGNPLIGRSVLQFFQEGALLAPVSRSVACYSFTSSQGIINLNNATFSQDTFYSILYT